MKKIVFAHLLNDFSGSPLVLSSIIKGVKKEGYEIDLFTCGEREGFLSDLGINYHYFPYRFFPNKYMRLVAFMLSQFILLIKMLWRYRNQDVVFYINTLLPIGASLAGKILGKKVVYHIHEVSIKPASFKRLLKGIANKTASSAIYVSNELMRLEALPDVKGKVVYNGLSEDFIAKANKYKQEPKNDDFTILMLCSLKDYKGVPEFVKLAERLSKYKFELVVNATTEEINNYFEIFPDLSNLTIFDVQRNVHPFYQRANLILNLSHPETWVETFGMTILEAMYYEKPCIVPTVGGPIELIGNGIEGYTIDQRDLEKVAVTINKMATDQILYNQLSIAAFIKAKQFSLKNMIQGAIQEID
jgi:glycosyltransferase involved in cell wall biosynthesis